MNFQPKKPLQTLSDFITQLEAETSNFTSSDAIEIVAYNNFLLQPITKEMFVGEEPFIFDQDYYFVFTFKKFKTVSDLAEYAKKENFGIYIKA